MRKKTVVIMQPGYLPWLGFFELMQRSDVFVIYDDVQFDKNSWRNRNRIKTSQGPLWLTVPVSLTNGLATKMNGVKIAQDGRWQRKHISAIEQNYSKAPFFKEHWPPIKRVIEVFGARNSLIDLDVALIECLAQRLGMEPGLKPLILKSSALGIKEPDRVKRLIKMVKLMNGNHFYEPAGGETYLGEKEITEFNQAGIEFEFQNYQHPEYRQLHGDFIPCLSVIDLLLNEGPRSLETLTQNPPTPKASAGEGGNK